MRKVHAFLAIALFISIPALTAGANDDPVEAWRKGVKIEPACGSSPRHTIHSYFNTSPESPDKELVLFFSSTTKDGQTGDVRIRNRESGKEKVLATNVHVEDAHRVACQQWTCGGKYVVFHHERDKEWQVTAVNIQSGEQNTLAHNQLSGWGQPNSKFVPLYGLHWNPGSHRDLELVNVETGNVRTVVSADAAKEKYKEWITKTFGEKSLSIFFPVLSPDLSKVFFKMAAATGGDPRSSKASTRQGLICYSLTEQRFLYMSPKWGHPTWFSDSRSIVEAGNMVYDSNTGKGQKIPGLPAWQGDHPSMSPDGKLVVTDTKLERLGGKPDEWGVVVADIRGTNYAIIHKFNNSHGAESWRRSHPHPVFSSDGRRIYFNVNSGQWTQLFVAERL